MAVHMDCEVLRSCVVTHLRWPDFAPTSRDFVEKPCGTPLFGERARRTAVCDSCFAGWRALGNNPTPLGLERIASARWHEAQRRDA